MATLDGDIDLDSLIDLIDDQNNLVQTPIITEEIKNNTENLILNDGDIDLDSLIDLIDDQNNLVQTPIITEEIKNNTENLILNDGDIDLDSLIDLIDDQNNLVQTPIISEEIKNNKENLILNGSRDVQLVDMFSTSSSNLQKSLPEESAIDHKESSLIHTGDTSDEDEKIFLTETGESIKKKIAIKNNYEHIKQKKFKIWKSQSDNVSVDKASSIDNLTGIKVVNPMVPFDVLNQRMQGRKKIRMSFLDNFLNKGDIDCDWVTFAVIVRKIPPKTSKTGKLFSIWKLCDLHNVDKIITVFLFGKCHNDLWKNSVGTVIGILNPSVMPPKDKNDGLCLTLDHPGKIMLVGKSKDFGYCKGIQKNGEKCKNIVNLSHCEYCVYHVKKEYQKFCRRSEIQSSYSGRELKFKDRILKGQNFFYGGQTFTPLRNSIKKSNIITSKDKLTLTNLTLKRKASDLFNEEKDKSIKKLTEMYGDEVSKAAEKNSTFINNQLINPSAGSKHFLQYMLKNKLVKKEESLNLINPKELLQQHGLQMKSKFISHTQKKDDSLILKNLIPQLGKDLSPGQNVSLCSSSQKFKTSMTPEAYAKLKAIQKIKQNGQIKRKNPNSVKSNPELQKIQAVLNNSIEGNFAGKSKFEENLHLTTNLNLNSENIQKVLNRKSSHAYEVEMAEMIREASYFDRLEKKEMLEEKMASTKEIVCDVVSCRQCLYTSHHAAERCKNENHPLKCHKAIKRFFECIDCHRRTECFTKFPKRSCRNCGSSKYIRTGMMKVRSGPKLDYESLQITNPQFYLE